MIISNKEITAVFLKEFDNYWSEMLGSINCQQIQLKKGNRLRPQICLWGYLATYPSLIDSYKTISHIASVSVSIEMIHKASIMLDDWIDEDCERHGVPSFHEEYTPHDAVITAFTIIGLSLKRLKQTVPATIINLPHYYFLCLDTLIDTIYSMANGALMEIRLNDKNIYDKDIIKEITQLETAEIIGNSMLIGYYTGLGEYNPNPIIVDKFKKIGDTCGYIFQAMNDLEVFSNPHKLYAHKGNLNSDVIKKRKNIAIATLYDIASKPDKKMLMENLHDNMYALMDKYNVLEILTYQLNDLFLQTKNTVKHLNIEGISDEWIYSFSSFLDYIKAVGEERLKQ